MWIAAMGMVYVFFSDRIAKQFNPNQSPQSQMVGSTMQVTLAQNRNGHYVTNGTINRIPVTFLIDTGATDISIPIEVAKELHLTKGKPIRVNTANGVITVYRTLLDKVAIGSLSLDNLKANINPHMHGSVLLGMSFLRNLDFEQQGKTLTLTGPAQ